MTQVCWQYLVKQQKEFQEPTTNSFDGYGPINIIPINWHEAERFILEYEWVGNMGTSKYCFGLSINNRLASVVCYGPPVVPTRYVRILGKDLSEKLLQLCRGASSYWAPKWSASTLISQSIKMLRGDSDLLIVIAYADPQAGEVGTIYQACNAYYLGKTSPGGGKRYVINGRTYDPRKVHKLFGSRKNNIIKEIDPLFYTLPIESKHRYMFVRGTKKKRREVYERIKKYIVLNYPKRF